jgi:hypothetical protein
VIEMLEGIVVFALQGRPQHQPLSRQARELDAARICYDHLAGRLSVDLTDFFVTRDYMMLGEEVAEITSEGIRFLTEFGIDLSMLRSNQRHFCRLCFDWTERRPHIAGSVGAALTRRYFDLGWTERMRHSTAVTITMEGKRGFSEIFGISTFEKTTGGEKTTGSENTTGSEKITGGTPRNRPLTGQ